MYASVFTHGFPTQDRTCIDSAALIYVDCARQHDRERIAWVDVTAAVRTGAFPNRVVGLPAATLAGLDRACTTYLRAVSTTTALTGVAEPDVDDWPTRTGRYRIACEADVAPGHRDGEDSQLRRAKRQQDRDRIVRAGVAIENDLYRHGRSLGSALPDVTVLPIVAVLPIVTVSHCVMAGLVPATHDLAWPGNAGHGWPRPTPP